MRSFLLSRLGQAISSSATGKRHQQKAIEVASVVFLDIRRTMMHTNIEILSYLFYIIYSIYSMYTEYTAVYFIPCLAIPSSSVSCLAWLHFDASEVS